LLNVREEEETVKEAEEDQSFIQTFSKTSLSHVLSAILFLKNSLFITSPSIAHLPVVKTRKTGAIFVTFSFYYNKSFIIFIRKIITRTLLNKE
jgi:hypothetical protein